MPAAASDQEYLVRIEIRLPPTMAEQEADELRAAELRRGRELRDAGHIHRIWRLPGRMANVGIWRAANVTELHDLLTSLPMFPWMDIQVTALAQHQLDELSP